MLAAIRDDTQNVLNIQHITPNSKRWDYSDTPGGGHKKTKGPAHTVEGGHHLRKAPNSHPQKHCEWGVADRRMDRTILKAAWSQLKNWTRYDGTLCLM